MGALGLGYLDTPVFFWAAQLPGGLGADQTRPRPGAEGGGSRQTGRLVGRAPKVRMTSQQQGQKAGGWGPTGAPQVLHRCSWVPGQIPEYMRQ